MPIAIWTLLVVSVLPGETGVAEGYAMRTLELPAHEAAFQVVLYGPSLTVPGAFEVLEEIGLTGGTLLADRLEGWADRRFLNLDNVGRELEVLVVIPLDKVKAVAAVLDKIGAHPPEGVLGVTFSVKLRTSYESIAEAQRRLLPELLAEARNDAARTARFNNAVLGELLWMDDTASGLSRWYDDRPYSRVAAYSLGLSEVQYPQLRELSTRQIFGVSVAYALR